MAVNVAIDEQRPLLIGDPSGIGETRRVATRLGESLGFDAEECGRLAIIATEVASNLVKHVGQGEILVRSLRIGTARGVGLLALDRGRGIVDMAGSMRDGFSTAGTTGTGLGSIARQSSAFDVHSGPGGTVLSATVWSRKAAPPPLPVAIGALCRTRDLDAPCGDGWAAIASEQRTLLLLVDGLGHGANAADAAAMAIRVFHAEGSRTPEEILSSVHQALRATRGAAGAIAALDHVRGQIEFVGIGNIAAVVHAPGAVRHMVSHHGTLGHAVRRIQSFSYPWPTGGTVIMHSDGIVSRWDLDAYPALHRRDPALSAAILYRDFERGRDDVSALVVRRRTP